MVKLRKRLPIFLTLIKYVVEGNILSDSSQELNGRWQLIKNN